MKNCCIFSMKMRNLRRHWATFFSSFGTRHVNWTNKFSNSSSNETHSQWKFRTRSLEIEFMNFCRALTEFSGQFIFAIHYLIPASLSIHRLSGKMLEHKTLHVDWYETTVSRVQGLEKKFNNPTHMLNSKIFCSFWISQKTLRTTAILPMNEHGKIPFIHLKIHRIFHFVNSAETTHNAPLALQKLIYRQSPVAVYPRNIPLLSTTRRDSIISSPSCLASFTPANPDYSPLYPTNRCGN